jgi:NTP pyrophosphatase (non-canonical NTP hydrolase)
MIGMINLEQNTVQWAEDRGILKNSTPQQQMLKLVSEMGELADNLAKGNNIEDDIGDCLVVLTIIAAMKNTTIGKSWNVAWNDIKDRKGFLNENGVFVKDTDKNYTQLLMEFDYDN